jgi:aminopeptidase
MAEVLVNYSVTVKPGDWVNIRTEPAGEPLAKECARAVLKAGGHPWTTFSSEEIEELLLREGSDAQLTFVSPVTKLTYEQVDVVIAILAPTNTRALTSVDPSRIAMRQKALEPLLATYLNREAAGEMRVTGAQYPTPAAAQDASMSLTDYEDFVYGAGLIDEPDPVEAWKQLGRRQEKVIEWLTGKETVQIVGPGTDLTLSVAGRTWVNDDGHANFPGGEVFTGPIEDSANGVIQFTYPAYLHGPEVTGVRLVFKDGKAVEASATGNEEYLLQMLGMDEGARCLGEFAFGTNPGIQRFTKNTLFDEKIGGTLHMAVGRSIPETGGVNESALHWDMVYNLREGAEVRVDGELFSKNGEFCI